MFGDYLRHHVLCLRCCSHELATEVALIAGIGSDVRPILHLHCRAHTRIAAMSLAERADGHTESQSPLLILVVEQRTLVRLEDVCANEHFETESAYYSELVPDEMGAERHWEYRESYQVEYLAAGIDDPDVSVVANCRLIGQFVEDGFGYQVAHRAGVHHYVYRLSLN